MNVLLPLLSCLVSLVFAALVLEQWWERRHSFQAVWAAGLLWYAVSAGTQFAGAAFGWSEPLYRAWYLIGAYYVAAYLGMGTIYLLAKTAFGYFAAVTVFLGGWMLPFGIHPPGWTDPRAAPSSWLRVRRRCRARRFWRRPRRCAPGRGSCRSARAPR